MRLRQDALPPGEMGAGSEDSVEDGSVDNKPEDCAVEPSTMDQSSLEENVQPPRGEVSSTRVGHTIL